MKKTSRIGRADGARPPRSLTALREAPISAKRGRYESAMWRAAGLEEPNAKGSQTGPGEQADQAAAEGEVDNMEAGGFFARFGREREGPRPTVIPPAARARGGAGPSGARVRLHRRPRRDWQRTRTTSNQNMISNTMFVYQYQYHSILIKKRPNTGMIPVNIPHCGTATGVRAQRRTATHTGTHTWTCAARPRCV